MRTSVPSTLPKVYPTGFSKALGSGGGLPLALLAAALPSLMQAAQSPGIEQPIPFSHRVHTSLAKLACNACHRLAGPAGRDMSIPPATSCLGCHRTVASTTPAIKRLSTAVRAGRPIEWEPVWFLPDFVWFSHRRHARAAGCATCHGPVEQRDVLWREVETDMKFCRSCHVKTGAKAICGTCHAER